MNATATPVLAIDSDCFAKLAKSRHLLSKTFGTICQLHGYHGYNQLVRMNSIFSSYPRGEPTDRTGRTNIPVKIYPGRPWKYYDRSIDLSTALRTRVLEIAASGQRINIMWSGGIDSTTICNAFIEHLPQKDQLRVLYSPFSQYEHGQYLDFIHDVNIETVDISGKVYMETMFDGLFFTGDGGDESYASIDQSFIDLHGFEVLDRPWKDFFWQQTEDQSFIDYCEEYFAGCGLEIQSVLEARWWFYINSKYRCMLNNKLGFWLDYPNFCGDLVQGFFDFDQFDQYVSHRIKGMIQKKSYHTWKQDLKDYCYSIDRLSDWRENKSKINSSQLTFYSAKKRMLKNLHSIFLMYDGRRLSTPHMPLFSSQEFASIYGHTLDGLWNEPDQI